MHLNYLSCKISTYIHNSVFATISIHKPSIYHIWLDKVCGLQFIRESYIRRYNSTYLLEGKWSSLSSPDLLHGHPLPVYASHGHGDELPQRGGAEEEGVVHSDHSLQARPRHHRTHSLWTEGGGREGERFRKHKYPYEKQLHQYPRWKSKATRYIIIQYGTVEHNYHRIHCVRSMQQPFLEQSIFTYIHYTDFVRITLLMS